MAEGATGGAAAINLPGQALVAQGGRAIEGARAVLGQPAIKRAMPAIGAVGVVAAIALVWSMIATPASRVLDPGASEADRAAMAGALTTAGISYSIDPDTGALRVPPGSYYQARMLLAGQGLPSGAPSATDIMDGMPLGASRAVEGERIRSSREADIAATIEAIDAVQSARVHLALAETSAFVRDHADPQASVMLTLKPGRALGDAQVQAIADLVASSVPGLAIDHVSIVDQRGQLLSRQAGLDNSPAGQQMALRRRMEGDYQQSIIALLTPILGAGNFSAEVNADLDFSEVQSTRDAAPQPNGVLESEQSQLSTESDAGTPPGGIPGTLSNTPPAGATLSATPPASAAAANAANAGATSGSATGPGRRSENVSRRYLVGREISVTHAQTPTLKRLTVAIALSNGTGRRARSAAEIQALQQLVQGAIGYDATRGDVVTITARPFTPVPEVATPFYEADWFMALLRNGALIIVAAILVFGLFWPLYKRHQRRQQDMAAIDALNQFNAQGADSSSARGSSGDGITIGMIEATQGYEARAAMIRAFVRQDPARAALVVRDLIKSSVDQGNDAHG